MKKLMRFLFFIINVVPLSLSAQHAVNITGNTLVANIITYAYSVGEVTGFSLTDHCNYTPGVIQPTRISVKHPEQNFFDNYHQVLVYPNPTTGVIIIETNDPGITDYTITAYDGKIVQTGKFNYLSINVQGLQKGLYLITLLSANYKRQQTYKIIKL